MDTIVDDAAQGFGLFRTLAPAVDTDPDPTPAQPPKGGFVPLLLRFQPNTDRLSYRFNTLNSFRRSSDELRNK
jgi:hypothetical protein